MKGKGSLPNRVQEVIDQEALHLWFGRSPPYHMTPLLYLWKPGSQFSAICYFLDTHNTEFLRLPVITRRQNQYQGPGLTSHSVRSSSAPRDALCLSPSVFWSCHILEHSWASWLQLAFQLEQKMWRMCIKKKKNKSLFDGLRICPVSVVIALLSQNIGQCGAQGDTSQ